MAAKTLWRLIKNPYSLWGKVLASKYCPNGSIHEWIRKRDKTYKNGSIHEWIRKRDKTYKNGSIGWKALVLAFPLVGNSLAWLVGNGRKIIVGEDPWSGARERYKLSEGLV